MSDGARKPRPQYTNIGLAQIGGYRLPWAGRVSILHRISGALLFVLLPFSLYLFEQSLTSELSFNLFKSFAAHPFVKIVILVLCWAFVFHLCAGVRFLLADRHYFVNRAGGRQTSLVVLIVSTIVTIVIALKLFGAF